MLAVIVIYQQEKVEVVAYRTLIQALSTLSFKEPVEILIYDHSPQAFWQRSDFQHEKVPVTYVADPRNLGLSTAYNYGWELLKQRQLDWLLLLDQDTTLTSDYLAELMDAMAHQPEAVVKVPQIYQGETLLAPTKAGQAVLPGIYEGEAVVSLNSGTCIHQSVLETLQGFTDEFPLDYLDHWFFFQVMSLGVKLQVLRSKLEHHLSMSEIETVSATRLRSVLEAEKRFIYRYQPEKKGQYRRHFWLRLIKYLVKDPKKVPLAWNIFRQPISEKGYEGGKVNGKTD
ncbi:glycosyltransferase [Vagococcus humatus]|uniref:Glycosyltransferase 2-like domain-containing protein n=1 Tax=Vagococcus humatus TaxID=1889241 RepID=A0A429Z836_9ENTE|nr:glycosyltransferase [Vagococcus humatus]RST89842.1 hypothetical protein C7P63_01825 [Vagococcus humatus]